MDKIAEALDNLMESVEYDGSRMESTLAWRDKVLALASPRCATCKHWQRFSHIPNWGVCELTDGVSTSPDYLMAAVGARCDGSWLETREDFGCVLHAPRDGE